MLERCAVIAILGFIATLGGCGLKGSLYLPNDRSQEVSSQPATTEEADDDKKRRSTSGGAPVSDATPAAPTDTIGAPPSPPPTGN